MKGNRYVVLAAGTAALLLLGVIYAWSVFVTPLEAAFGWKRSQTSTVFTLSMCFFCFGGIPGGALSRRIGHRWVLCIAALCMLLGFSGAAFFASLPGLYLGYGCLCGLGVGLGYNAVCACVIQWFPDKPGFCNGVLLVGFSCGAMVFSAACTALMDALGWRVTFYVLAAAFFLALCACSFALRPPPMAAAAQNADGVTTRAMLQRPSFYYLFVWLTLLLAGGMMIVGNAAPLALDAGASASGATLAAGLIAGCNGAGRILFGAIFDRQGRRTAMLCVALCNMAALCALAFALRLGAMPLFIAGCCLQGAGYGGCPVVCLGCVNRFYGARYYGTNLAVANLYVLFASLIGSQLTGALYVRLGSYLPMMWGFLLLYAIPMTCTFLIREDRSVEQTAG